MKYAEDPAFQKKWAAVKQSNKERLARHIETTLGLKVNTQAMFDVQIKVSSFRYSKIMTKTMVCSVCMSTRYDRDPEFFLDWHFEIRLFVLRSVKL